MYKYTTKICVCVFETVNAAAEFSRSKMQQAQGYDVTDAEAIENGLRGAGDYAIMDAAFKLAHAGPKYISFFLLRPLLFTFY